METNERRDHQNPFSLQKSRETRVRSRQFESRAIWTSFRLTFQTFRFDDTKYCDFKV